MGMGIIGFDVFGTLFFIAFFAILAIIVAQLIRGALQWNKNNHSPRLTVDATVVGRRQEVHHHHHGGEMHHTHTSTSYYVTFQVDSGDRMELQIPTSEFGYLIEGDRGQLTFQGTRFLSFRRS